MELTQRFLKENSRQLLKSFTLMEVSKACRYLLQLVHYFLSFFEVFLLQCKNMAEEVDMSLIYSMRFCMKIQQILRFTRLKKCLV